MNYSFENTILVLTDNDKLVKKLENIASSFGIRLFLADPNKPNILAVPYFIAVVDKKYFPKEDKAKYVDVLDKSEIFYTDEFEVDEIVEKVKKNYFKNH